MVAIDPSTGAILALVSKPSYDPNVLASHDTAAVRAAWAQLNADPSEPMANRAIAGDTYPPGSTFKLVTAAAALESGMSPDTSIAAPDSLPLPNTTAVLTNYGGERCSATEAMTLLDALRVSCNTAFGKLGMNLGADALRRQAEAFGFDTPLSIPLPVTPSRFPAAGEIDAPQTAMSAIGQYDVRVTPAPGRHGDRDDRQRRRADGAVPGLLGAQPGPHRGVHHPAALARPRDLPDHRLPS